MRPYLVIVSFLSFFTVTRAQNSVSVNDSLVAQTSSAKNTKTSVFYLQNTLKAKKVLELKSDFITIYVEEKLNSRDKPSRFNTIECAFDTLLPESLVVSLMSEEIETEYANRFMSTSVNYYSGNFSPTLKTIALNDLVYISTKNAFRRTSTNIARIIMAASVLAIVVSPLAGINLEGDARRNARSQVFIAGAAGFGFSIPLFIIGRNKKYGISPNYNTSAKNYWLLKQKLD